MAEPEDRARLRGVFRNAGILLTGKGANAVLSLAALGIAARALGQETLGVLVLIHAFTQAVGEIAKFQSWQAVIRYGAPALQEGDHERFGHLVRLTAMLDVASAVAGGLLCAVLAGLIGPRLGWPPELVWPAILYTTSVLFMVTATPTGLLRLLDRFKLLSVNATIASLIRFLGGAAIWALGGGIGWFLLAWYAATAASGLFLIGAAWATLRREGMTEGLGRRRARKPSAAFPRFWRFVWTTNANTSADLAFGHLGVLAVGWLLGPSDAALFRVAKQVADGVAKPARLLVPAIYPELARLFAEGRAKALGWLMLRAGLMAGALVTVLLVAIVFLGGPVLVLVGGEGFEAAYGLMLWLVGAGVVGVWVFPLEPMLISGGRAGSALAIRLLTAAIYLPALYLALTQMGLVGAGWARFGAAVLMAGALLFWVTRWYRTSRSAP